MAALLAAQYRRWHAADPRLPGPPQVERAARRVIEADEDLPANWGVVAERAAPAPGRPALAGYLRAWRRHFGPDDPQLMWLPADHQASEILYQFAAAPDLDPGAIFAALFPALEATSLAPAGTPWVVSLVPAAAGLDPALAGLGFRATSVFAYRPHDPAPPAAAPPPGITIRPAGPRDSAAVTHLYAALCAYHTRNDPFADREPPGLEAGFATLLHSVFAEPRHWVLLVAHPAAAPGDLLGFALASVETEARDPALITQLPPGAVGFIHDFFVVAAARRSGLGRALWCATLAALQARAPDPPARGGLHGTWLIYRPTNPSGARFWPALGYTPLYLMWRRGGWEATR